MAASSRYETFSIEQKSDHLEGTGDIEQLQVPVMSRAEACLPPGLRIGEGWCHQYPRDSSYSAATFSHASSYL